MVEDHPELGVVGKVKEYENIILDFFVHALVFLSLFFYIASASDERLEKKEY